MTVADGTAAVEARAAHVRRGLVLNYVTLGYNAVEAVVSLAAGVVSGSVALVGFGVDSAIELTAAAAAQWRLRADLGDARRERVERWAVRAIGWSFLALAAYVLADSIDALWTRERPERSVPGIAILAASVIVMPLLARAKRRIAVALGSRTLAADATQTSLCAWADPVAALAMVPIIAREGLEGIRGEEHCDDCR